MFHSFRSIHDQVSDLSRSVYDEPECQTQAEDSSDHAGNTRGPSASASESETSSEHSVVSFGLVVQLKASRNLSDDEKLTLHFVPSPGYSFPTRLVGGLN